MAGLSMIGIVENRVQDAKEAQKLGSGGMSSATISPLSSAETRLMEGGAAPEEGG